MQTISTYQFYTFRVKLTFIRLFKKVLLKKLDIRKWINQQKVSDVSPSNPLIEDGELLKVTFKLKDKQIEGIINNQFKWLIKPKYQDVFQLNNHYCPIKIQISPNKYLNH